MGKACYRKFELRKKLESQGGTPPKWSSPPRQALKSAPLARFCLLSPLDSFPCFNRI
jgi:hypothetical protein